MSDDKQLTVAELLARAGKEKSDGDGAPGSRGAGKDGSDKPRRRRRRSMEDGGVSVAELTGSFPKVKAKPKESKHGSPIDEASGEQAGKKPSAGSTSGSAAAGKAPASVQKPAPGAATPATPSSKEKTSQGTDGRSQSSRTGAGSGRGKQAGKQSADSAGAQPADSGKNAGKSDSAGAQPADSGKNAGKSDSAGSGKNAGKGASSEKTKPVDGATGADKTATKQQDSRTKTKSFTVNRKPAEQTPTKGSAEQTPTKGSEKASNTSNKASGASGAAAGSSGSTLKSGAAAKPGSTDAVQSAKSGQQDKPGSQGLATKPADAAKSVPEKPSPASDETAEISRVTDAHAEQEHSSKDEGDTVTTGEIPKVDSAGRATSTAKQQAGQRASDDTSEFQSVDDAATQSSPGVSSAQKSKNKQKSGGFGSPIPSAAEQREQEAPVHAGPDVDAGTDAENDESIAEGEGMNPLAVVLLALTGIILGVVVFKGFEMLWGSLNNFLVAALAVGVTGVMAGIVHALRTERDGLSMTLAVIVGLLLTFGPAVLVVL